MLTYGVKRFLAKISNIFLIGFLLLIPTQLGKHFWPDWSFVMGVRSDYLSPVLYLTDLLWLGIVMFNFKILISNVKKLFNLKTLLIIGFVIINIVVASSPMVAIYKWLRIGQLLISIVWIKNNKELVKNYLIKIIPVWLVGESLLVVAQIANNGSLNGIFYWLGERNFTFNTVGIAQMSVFGRGLIRGYGTFSHPNSLAGFLLVSLVLWKGLKPGVNKVLDWMVLWVSIVGIILSGSRTIWILGLGVGIYYLIKSFLATQHLPLTKRRNSYFDLVLILGLFLGLFGTILTLINRDYWLSDFLGGWDKESWSKRLDLMKISLGIIKKSPIVGIGAGNFIVELGKIGKTTWLQPVHNIFLLVANELGLMGILGIILVFKKWLVNLNKVTILLLILIGLSGMVDHYWLTLMQNNWLLVLVFGLI